MLWAWTPLPDVPVKQDPGLCGPHRGPSIGSCISQVLNRCGVFNGMSNSSPAPTWSNFLKSTVNGGKPQTFELCSFGQLGHLFWASIPLKTEKAVA